MRKTINILFAAIYFFVTTGFTVTLHYCGGEVSNISIVRTYGDKDPCGCDSNSCKDSCCKDEIHTIKLADSHKSEAKFVQNSFLYLIAFYYVDNYSVQQKSASELNISHQHGDAGPLCLFLYNSSFLI